MVQIGYCIGQDWWYQGIMTEALKAVIDFFFEKVEVNRIESRHDPRNPHSGKVMEKCGMKYEGTMRSSDKNNQGICDICGHGGNELFEVPATGSFVWGCRYGVDHRYTAGRGKDDPVR